MEQEAKTNSFAKILTWLKSNIVLVGIIVAVIVIAIVLVNVIAGGPKRAVKSYISALNSQKAEKVVKAMDVAGEIAWIKGGYYDLDKFDKDDYKDFIDDYDDVDKDDIKDESDDTNDYYDDKFDDQKDDYKSYKTKVEEIKKVEKLGKNLYSVKAKISVNAKPKDKDDDEIDKSSTITYVVYKNKVIASGY